MLQRKGLFQGWTDLLRMWSGHLLQTRLQEGRFRKEQLYKPFGPQLRTRARGSRYYTWVRPCQSESGCLRICVSCLLILKWILSTAAITTSGRWTSYSNSVLEWTFAYLEDPSLFPKAPQGHEGAESRGDCHSSAQHSNHKHGLEGLRRGCSSKGRRGTHAGSRGRSEGQVRLEQQKGGLGGR